ncbi:ATP-sensitive inward rectifier potassium channel 1-like [Ostrinia nubilalis]|uniref:ATP-sensitive inward rectifier potassium channel 1-like n=1 Tax=Ostrinia nubilalis TaxID=29057 RepID=UPI0030825DC3
MENDQLIKDLEFEQINLLYDECVNYLKKSKDTDIFQGKKYHLTDDDFEDPDYEIIKEKDVKNNSKEEANDKTNKYENHNGFYELKIDYKVENEIISGESVNSLDVKSERLRKLSQQLPKIIITQSNTSLDLKEGKTRVEDLVPPAKQEPKQQHNTVRKPPPLRRGGYGEFPKRLVSKNGVENVALISNVPFGKIRLLNDTFHTLINLQWRWIVMGTVLVHFTIWLVFAVFWYITALAHYDFEPNPPNKTCVTGGKDFVNIFLASVEAQTTIGFGDRTIDEECPESIFLFIMQLILGTGLSGVLTCVVYAKLTRPEKLSRDGVGFSKKAVISLRDGKLCLMMRAWDLNYDHIISSEFTAHFVNTHRTKEGEMLRYYARGLTLQQNQFLLWPVTLVHEINEDSPLFHFTPQHVAHNSYEITVSLKGASASMGTFTQSQTSYLPKEVIWGHRFPPVVKYDTRKQKYVIDHQKLDATEPVDTPNYSASQLYSMLDDKPDLPPRPGTPSSFSDKISAFQLERTSSFKRRPVKP